MGHELACGTGDPCVVFDCIVNPEVIKDCKEDRTGSFRHFVCELAIQYVETKVCAQKLRLPHRGRRLAVNIPVVAPAAQDALGPQVQAAAIAVQGLHRAVTEDTQEAGSRH